MDWNEFLKQHADALLALVAGGAGAVFTAVFGAWRERVQRRRLLEDQQRARDQELADRASVIRMEFHDNNIVRPIIDYVDLMLRHVEDVHWSAMDRKEPKSATPLEEIRLQGAPVKARARMLGNKTLVDLLERFGTLAFVVRRAAAEGQAASKGYEKRLKLLDVAGEIFAQLEQIAVPRASVGTGEALPPGGPPKALPAPLPVKKDDD